MSDAGAVGTNGNGAPGGLLDTDRAAWGRRAKASARGMTLADINDVKPYGDIPAQSTATRRSRKCIASPTSVSR